MKKKVDIKCGPGEDKKLMGEYVAQKNGKKKKKKVNIEMAGKEMFAKRHGLKY